MATILFFFFAWLVCKAIRALFKPHDKPKRGSIQARQAGNNNSMAALIALQQQRDNINETIQYLNDCICSSENPRETIGLLDKRSTQYSKLANVEQKIIKLIS